MPERLTALTACAQRPYRLALALWLGIATPAMADAPPEKSDVAVLSLEDVKNLALTNNHGVRDGRLRREAAEQGVSAARGHFFPEIGIESTVGTYHDRQSLIGDPEIPVVARDRNHYDIALVLKQNLFKGLEDRYRNKAADEHLAVAEAEQKAIEAEALKQVVTLYFGIQLGEAKYAAEEEVRKLRSRQLKTVSDKLGQGRATQLEFLQAKYALSSQLPNVEDLRVEIETMKLKLALAASLPIERPFRLKDELPDAVEALTRTALPSLEEALPAAIDRNLELIRLKHAIDKARAEWSMSEAKHRPRVDLALRAGSTASLREDVGTPDYSSYSGLVSVTVPLFSGLTSVYERREHAQSLEALREQLRQKEQVVIEQLHAAYRELELAGHRIGSEKENLALAEQVVQQAQNLYGVGKATLVEVLDSYSQKLKAQQDLAKAMYDRITAVAEINFILGKTS